MRLSGGTAYARVKGRWEGRFSTAAWNALALHLRDDGGKICLDAEGGPFVLREGAPT